MIKQYIPQSLRFCVHEPHCGLEFKRATVGPLTLKSQLFTIMHGLVYISPAGLFLEDYQEQDNASFTISKHTILIYNR